MDYKVLIIDADETHRKTLSEFLEKENYITVCAADGAEGVSTFRISDPDIVLLDVLLPKKDGFAVIRELRTVSAKPIIAVSAKAESFDKVLALELGADDYVARPYDERELLARIKAVMRRYNYSAALDNSETVKFDKMEISLQKYSLRLDNKPVSMPPKELELLYFLASNCNKTFTRDQLLDKVWGYEYLGDSRTVDVHIKRIRDKIDSISDGWALITVWGKGYKFEVRECAKES